jgi:carbon monoxide dehydrogenase subunit G
MKLENRCLVPAGLETTWDLVMDIPCAAACVPGLREIRPDGEDRYRTAIQVRVGPMRLDFSGTVSVLERDPDKRAARFQVEASDRRVGASFRATMTLSLKPLGASSTELCIVTDTAFMGKLGELGQPVVRRKAASTVEEFAQKLAKQVAGREP